MKHHGRGPLVLSLAHVQLDLEQPWDGYNAVMHEMAHKLDILDGQPNGVSPLVEIPRRRWILRFQQAFERRCDRPKDSLIDPYAAERPGEYFAEVGEIHQSRPALLRQTEQEIAAMLRM